MVSLTSTNAEPTGRPLSNDLAERDRQRISYLRLVLVLALVFLHYGGVYGSELSPYRGYQGQALPFASILISFILYIGFTAVPAMSAISGFLFFKGASREVSPKFIRKWRSRAVSLALPFLLWSSAFAALAFAVHMVAPDMFNQLAPNGHSTVRLLADAVLGLTRTPVAFQLWFVRDLMVTIIVSPIIWFLVGRAPLVTIAVLTLLWVADHDLWIFLRLDVPLFFSFGAACAMHGFRPDLPARWVLPVFVLFLVVAMGRTVAPYYVGYTAGWGFDVATAAMRVLGALAVWNAASLALQGSIAAWVQRHSHLAFYIHCAHYPPILFIKIGLGQFINERSEAAQVALYFATVALVISLLIASARLMQRRLPRVFKVLSGGRTKEESVTRGGFLTA